MGLLAICLLSMVVLSALQILLRNVFGAGVLWIDPLLRYLTLWIGFLGAALAAAEGRHIQIDVLSRACAG
jgi:TRAP-type C4-dicarboxylate transport system permease small subunit